MSKGSFPTRLLTVLVLFLYLLVAILATYPLVRHLDEKVAFNLGDPLFISWLVTWNDNFFLGGDWSLGKLFNTNIFYPHRNTLAYSDLMLAPSLMALPLVLLARNPLVTVNGLLIMLLTFSGFAFFLLARYLTKNSWAALLAGFFYVFSNYHQAQMGHIQLHTDGFLLLMLFYLHKYLDGQKAVFIFAAVFTLWLEALSSWYYAIYGVMLLLFFTVFFAAVGKLKINRSSLAAYGAALCLLGLLTFPFIRFYLELNRTMPDFVRNVHQAAAFSANLSDYYMAVSQNFFWGRLIGLGSGWVENVLFPGLAVLVLSAIGLRGSIKGLRAGDDLSLIKLFYVLVGAMAFFLSFGPYKQVFGRVIPLPFLFFFNFFPGFKSMRVPARFGLLVLFSLCVLAAFGLTRLYDIWRRRRGQTKWADPVLAAAVLLIIGQQISWGAPVSEPIRSGDRIPAIYRWLAEDKSNRPILELPITLDLQIKYVYYSIYHNKRLVNGYSGYTPPLLIELEREMADFPSKKTIALLKDLNIRRVLIHTDLIPDWKNKRRRESLEKLRLVKKMGADYLFELKREGRFFKSEQK